MVCSQVSFLFWEPGELVFICIGYFEVWLQLIDFGLLPNYKSHF